MNWQMIITMLEGMLEALKKQAPASAEAPAASPGTPAPPRRGRPPAAAAAKPAEAPAASVDGEITLEDIRAVAGPPGGSQTRAGSGWHPEEIRGCQHDHPGQQALRRCDD